MINNFNAWVVPPGGSFPFPQHASYIFDVGRARIAGGNFGFPKGTPFGSLLSRIQHQKIEFDRVDTDDPGIDLANLIVHKDAITSVVVIWVPEGARLCYRMSSLVFAQDTLALSTLVNLNVLWSQENSRFVPYVVGPGLIGLDCANPVRVIKPGGGPDGVSNPADLVAYSDDTVFEPAGRSDQPNMIRQSWIGYRPTSGSLVVRDATIPKPSRFDALTKLFKVAIG